MILDVHTHRKPPYPEGIISVAPDELPEELTAQRYSVGIHPWKIPAGGVSEEEMDKLRKAALRPDVVAIGECGIDLMREGMAPAAIQMNVLKKHIEISESVKKPLILHSVKGQEIICGMRKEMKPEQEWIIHGFRGKPTILDMYLKAGIAVSYGEHFNEESVRRTPPDKLYTETDESQIPIREIIAGIERIRN